MDREEINNQEEYSNMVNHNTILLGFEGWVKYIEGFSRGLQTAKTVSAESVLECVGEIMEYMKTLRKDIMDILTYCEDVLDSEEKLQKANEELTQQLEVLQNNLLLECNEDTKKVSKKKEKE